MRMHACARDLRLPNLSRAPDYMRNFSFVRFLSVSTAAMVRPNAFISIRIPSPDIKEKLTKLQDEMVKTNRYLRSSMVSLDKLHLTLMVMRLSNEEEEERSE